MTDSRRTLGKVIFELRTRNGWTLKEMSGRCGIPVSTLSKIEHDQSSLTYDKLQQLAEKLDISVAELFASPASAAPGAAIGRRSIGTIDRAIRIDTPNYEYHYLCTDLRQKRMVPVISRVHARSLDDFGDLLRHAGEEFIYVASGAITVYTEFYEPVDLFEGESIYIDSGMGHAYVCAPGFAETTIVSVMTSDGEDVSELIRQARREAMKDKLEKHRAVAA